MASLHHYICTNSKCDFEIHTEPYGHYALMSGEYFEFRCPGCREILTFSAEEIARYSHNIVECPRCAGNLYTWNATDGTCPKCNSPLQDTGIDLLAD
ncbi:MAG: hypothetical protein NC117_05750 [Pseudoflavonifractor sp.]|nr:hypothetical protein [Pseudoflavonifractor sp.]